MQFQSLVSFFTAAVNETPAVTRCSCLNLVNLAKILKLPLDITKNLEISVNISKEKSETKVEWILRDASRGDLAVDLEAHLIESLVPMTLTRV